MRYYRINYLKKPDEFLDPEHFYSDKNTFLASLGVNYIGYEQDRYIFRHQDIEDIPIGKSVALIGGVQDNLGYRTPYLGGRLRYGDYFSFGYLAADVQLGRLSHPRAQQTNKPYAGSLPIFPLYSTFGQMAFLGNLSNGVP